jgi:hypothetical protein
MMHRRAGKVARAALAALLTPAMVGSAIAQQRQQSRPPVQRPPVVIPQDRWFYGPPPPPSSDRRYYEPAPGIQRPMDRVPPPAPLAEPPIRR